MESERAANEFYRDSIGLVAILLQKGNAIVSRKGFSDAEHKVVVPELGHSKVDGI